MEQELPVHCSKSDNFQIALVKSLLTLTNGVWHKKLTFILAKPSSQNLLLAVTEISVMVKKNNKSSS